MIRKSEHTDIESILSIWLSASIRAHDFIDAEFWVSQVDNMRDIYLPASETYVFVQNETVIGFYSLYKNTLAAIFIEPKYQGQGFGRELLDHAKSKRNELTLTVYKANERSCLFYKKHGFAVVQEQVDPHTGCIELFMRIST